MGRNHKVVAVLAVLLTCSLAVGAQRGGGGGRGGGGRGGGRAGGGRSGGGRGGEDAGRGRGASETPEAPIETLTKVESEIRKNPKLEERIMALLPAGTSLVNVTAGFKNLDQFLTAVHASIDLKLPLDSLKIYLVGKQMPLAKSIQSADSTFTKSQAEAAAKKAEKEATDTRKSAGG